MFNVFPPIARSRSKSSSRRQTLDNSSPSPTSSLYQGLSDSGIPLYSQQPTSQTRPRSRSGGYYRRDAKGLYHHENPYLSEMSYTSISPIQQPLYYGVPQQGHYFHQGQVRYPGNSRKGHLDDSLLSSHLETQPRGRPRSNTAHEKLQISTGAGGAYHVPLVEGYASAPSSHEGSKSGIFGFIQNIRARSKSKSRERDALFSAARSTGSTHSINSYSHRAVDSRGRPLYEKDLQKGEYRDVEAELTRQMERMEKDLRLQDMEDPYRPVRRDRSRSIGSMQSVDSGRGSESRRHRDLDPDVRDNTKYNAVSLKYHALDSSRPSPMARIHSEMGYNSGYATDVQPAMHRRSTTGTVQSSRSSRTNPASRGAPLSGWFNQRGDQFINKTTVIRQPKDHEYSQRFAHYPEVGRGFADSKGNVIDAFGHLIKRVG